MKQPTDQITPEAVEPDVDVWDAWMHGFKLAKGFDDLLSMAAGSDEGIAPEGAKVMGVAAERLIEHMTIIDAYFQKFEK